MKRPLGFLILLLVLSSGPPAQAKSGPTITLHISGPGLEAPIEVMDVHGALHNSLVNGTDPVDEPRSMGAEYLMRFFVEPPEDWDKGVSAVIEKGFYPFAEGGPVTYTESGQAMPGYGNYEDAPGGWRTISGWIMTDLEARGLPGAEPSPGMSSLLILIVLALAAGVFLLTRHRIRQPVPA